jgi:uncharacterized protein (DUF1501 family)
MQSKIARREVLASLSLGGLAALFGAGSARAQDRAREKVLVCIFMRGAVDGLSLVVPYNERAYYTERSSIAIARPGAGVGAALDLDGQFGLHPRLGALLPAYQARELCFVHAVGLPRATRSHFDAQDDMESGQPGQSNAADGWLSRLLSLRDSPSLERSIALGPRLPRALSGAAPSLLLKNLASFDLHGPRRSRALLRQGFERLYAGANDVVGQAGLCALSATLGIQRLEPKRYSPENGAVYPKQGLRLRDAAQLIKSGLGVQVVWLDVGGWDTHAGQGGAEGTLGKRLDELASSLAAFRSDLGERFRDVTVLTMTEFGRTVAQNGTGGTDHGHGALMMVLGGAVAGGRVVTKWPGLEPEQRFEGRDLAVTTDFRDLFAEVSGWSLGSSDFSRVFPNYTPSFPGVMRAERVPLTRRIR